MPERRTRLGKVVGSVRCGDTWTYWPEKNWTTGEPGFVVVAPSGARMQWFADEADALLATASEQRDWDAS